MIQIHDQTPISQIRDEQKIDDKAKIMRMEAELAAEKEDKLAIMEATAQIYEELLALKEQIGGTVS